MAKNLVSLDDSAPAGKRLPVAVRSDLGVSFAPLWHASAAYATGAPVVLSNGTTGKRTAAGTSRATFDATELALWTVASGATTVDGLTDARTVAKDSTAAAARTALGAGAGDAGNLLRHRG